MLQTAIVAQRVANGDPDTTEIRELTEAAGARILGEVTQTRARDPGTHLGSGKVEELADLVAERGADTVVVDGQLTPKQTVTLEDAVGASVVDRQRVVLEIFADQARTPRAQTQAELARLRYQLPRFKERQDEGALNRYTETGTRYYDLLDRIDELERKLDSLPAVDEQYRKQRRDAGLDLVAIAGYTNAGKSTLLRRLADDMSLADATHADLNTTAAVEDRLFKTLETTTRRGTIHGRDVLLTDTVGFLDDLPHWLVESFRGTLREVAAADAVLLVADGAQPTPELRRKLAAVHETIDAESPPVVTVFNKVDLVEDEVLRERVEALRALAPNPVMVSAREGPLHQLESRLVEVLPSLSRTTIKLPQSDASMSFVSRVYDEAVTVDVTYEGDLVVVEFAAKQETVERLHARAQELPMHV